MAAPRAPALDDVAADERAQSESRKRTATHLKKADTKLKIAKTASDDGLRDSSGSSEAANNALATELARRVLMKTWGFKAFLLKQEQAVSRLITGGSAVVVFPTGGGKSLVYQVPAIAFEEWDKLNGVETRNPGVTLVVSPLIALMKDQVGVLKDRGVAAAALDSSQSRDSVIQTVQMLKEGRLKLLYVAPERLNNEGFVETIKHIRIRMVAVDEAHCISEWGHAFRPDYLKVARFVKEIEAERVLCLTATASPRVVVDIREAFSIPAKGTFKTTTYRKNLRLLARSVATSKEKLDDLIQFFRKNSGPGIVYVATHAQTEEITTQLKKAGFNAVGYHAGMPNDQRSSVQDRFMKSLNIIIVATIAFGMGIDKANIRSIVHYTLPKSPESYSQEIGRAGRDNLPSTCLCYLFPDDLRQLENFSRADVPSLVSLRGMLTEFFESNKKAAQGDVVDVNQYKQSQDWDMRPVTMNMLYAQLELRFGLLRATTPKYNKYEYTVNKALVPKDNITSALVTASHSKKRWTSIDVDTVSVPREKAVRRLQDWNDSGVIELKTSGVISRYRIMAETLPKAMQQEDIISRAYQQMEEKEADNIARVKAVIKLLTSAACIPRMLAAHFGDEKSVPQNGCGNCVYCETGKQVIFDPVAREKAGTGTIDQRRLNAVVDACASETDDARFLARVAWGVSSPRIIKMKLNKNPVWESMTDCDFEELIKAFTKIHEDTL